MTERAYITVDRAESPRLIQIADVVSGGDDQVIIQDLHDTLNSNTLSAGDPDDSLDNMDDDFLIDSAGKEDLGGGVLVGVTAALQNAQIAFAGNYVPTQTGTATSADATGLGLTDTNAFFDANGVQRGDWVVNFTDQSVSEVLRVISDTVLQHRVLKAGNNNDWEIGDAYAIFEIVQKEIAGGNVVASDDGGSSISAIFPSFATQVVRTSSSSATLQEQADIEYASFGGGVTIDITSIFSGTAFPTGTPRQPVNNIADAHTILVERGFDIFYIIGDLTVSSGTHDHKFVGRGVAVSTITLGAGADLEKARFEYLTITGTLDGSTVLIGCTLETIDFFNGVINSCLLSGTIALDGGLASIVLDSWSDIGGATIDMGGSGQSLSMQNFHGHILITNKIGADVIEIGMSSGEITIDNSVTNGVIELHGVGTWTNELTYTGGATIHNELIDSRDVQHAAFDGAIAIDPINGVSGTEYPTGTLRNPVDNLADAKLIAMGQGLDKLSIIGNMVFTATDDLSGYVVVGQNISRTMVTIDAATATVNTEFQRCTLTGSLAAGSDVLINDCIMFNVQSFEGVAFRCMLLGFLSLLDDPTTRVALLSCYSATPNAPLPSILIGDASMIVRDFSGGFVLASKTGVAAVSVDIHGEIEVADAVAAGTVILRGLGSWTNKDSYAGTATVVDNMVNIQGYIDALDNNNYDGNTFSEIQAIMLSMAQGRIRETSLGSNVFEFFAQDNTTVLYTLTKTATERNRS